jgi:hypothetical protein
VVHGPRAVAAARRLGVPVAVSVELEQNDLLARVQPDLAQLLVIT